MRAILILIALVAAGAIVLLVQSEERAPLGVSATQAPRPEPATPDPASSNTAGAPASTAARDVVEDPPQAEVTPTERERFEGEIEVLVVVRDHRGEPAPGVDVGFARGTPDRWQRLLHGETDDAGEMRAALPAKLLGQPLVAEAVVPAPERPRALFTLKDPAEPIELTLPPTGQVEVVLEHDYPVRVAGAKVWLGRVGDTWDSVAGARNLEAKAHNGRAVFERVAVGVDLEVSAMLPGSNINRRTTATGPTFADSVARVTLDMNPTRPVLVADLQDDRGEPLRDVQLMVRMQAQRQSSVSTSSFSAHSGPDGVMVFELLDDFGAIAERTIEIAHDRDQVELTVRVELPDRLSPGEHHLGILRLTPPPLVCEGQVVDETGVPIAGVDVAANRSDSGPSIDLPRPRTDAEGRFAIRGITTARLTLFATHDDFISPAPRPIALGERGIVIALQRAGAIAGRVTISGEVPARRLRVTARATGDDFSASRDVVGDGRFELTSLRPGAFDVEVTVFGLSEPVARVGGVVVVAGETTRDPRLEIDLSTTLRRVSFVVVDGAGNRLTDAIAIALGGAPKKRCGVYCENGEGSLLASQAPLALAVYAPGYALRHLADVQDGQTIQLDAAGVARLRVPIEAVTAAAPNAITLWLMPTDSLFDGEGSYELLGRSRTSQFGSDPPWWRLQTGSVAADGSVSVPMQTWGPCRVLFQLQDGTGGQVGGIMGTPDELDVAPDGREHLVALTAEMVEDAQASGNKR